MTNATAIIVLVLVMGGAVLWMLWGEPEIAVCEHCFQVIQRSEIEEDAWFHADSGLRACHGLETKAAPDRTVFL